MIEELPGILAELFQNLGIIDELACRRHFHDSVQRFLFRQGGDLILSQDFRKRAHVLR